MDRNSQAQTSNESFEEQLSKFLKDSEERQQSIKKNFDDGRGSSYKKSHY